MKIVSVLLVLLAGSIAQAQIINSNLEARHQALIQKAIAEQCHFKGELSEVGTISKETSIDQGIVDVSFVTILEFTERVDQVIFNKYEATVVSNYYSAYDHDAKDWGLYQIESVRCTMK